MIEGLVSVPCSGSAVEAADRLEAAIASRGMHVFARIDHGAGAASVGLPLPPTIVILFGDPRAGTLLMQAVQELGLELPLKVLCWTDATGASHYSYTDPKWLAARFGVDHPVVGKMRELLAALVA